MEYSLEELKNRYRAIRLFEEGSAEEEKKRVGQTVCGFDFDPGHCRLCMYHDTCAGRIRGARSAGWQRRMQSFRALNELELAVRNSLNEKQSRQEPPGTGGSELPRRRRYGRPDPEEEQLLALLAKVLRTLARSPVVQNTNDANRAEEACRIFEDLYYSTGDPEYREQMESCRLLVSRMR